MRGDTFFQPSETFWSDTWFESAFLLAGWNINESWRIAGRAEVFSTNEARPGTGISPERARPRVHRGDQLSSQRLAARDRRIYPRRSPRAGSARAAVFPPDAIEDQFQLSLRFYVP